jgi:hypothetical protein
LVDAPSGRRHRRNKAEDEENSDQVGAPRFCVVTFRSAGVPPRIASKARRSARQLSGDVTADRRQRRLRLSIGQLGVGGQATVACLVISTPAGATAGRDN